MPQNDQADVFRKTTWPADSIRLFAEQLQTPRFHEKFTAIFRAEFFKVFNRTEFQNPSGGPTSFYSEQLGQAVSTFDPRIGHPSIRLAIEQKWRANRILASRRPGNSGASAGQCARLRAVCYHSLWGSCGQIAFRFFL